ncbi:MAG: hypothetical protein U9M95_00095 [Candidatus Altiarchaeota archaeon]|nr:hypothetical protein [Candidatus Altiarchaeota archaeon]
MKNVVLVLLVAYIVLSGFVGSVGAQAIIDVYPTDDGPTQRSKVEGAEAGDTVLFHPGTYDAAIFKITNSGNATDYITFKAYDPSDEPVFNMSRWGHFDRSSDSYFEACTWGLGEWSGGDWGAGDGVVSCTGGESWNRGVFVIWRAGYINIEDLEFINVHNHDGNGAGIAVNAEGGPVNIRRCKVTYCDFGFGQRQTYNNGSSLVTVSNCEFAWNGEYPNQNPPGGHNIYTSGGTVIFEYCYVHDSQCGQLFHIRNIEATFRYCWFENPYSFMGDMSDIRENLQCTGCTEPDEQVLTFIGNIFVDGKLAEDPYPNNNIFVMMEGMYDEPLVPDDSPVPQRLNLYYNTFIGQSDYASDQYNLITFSGWGGHETYLPALYMYNNIFYNVYAPRFLRNQYTGTYRTREIQNNWLHGSSADYSAFSAWMSNNIFGTDPGFVGGGDYNLNSDSNCRDQANPTLGEFPGYEYLHNMESQIRESVNDLGAFEYGEATGHKTDTNNDNLIDMPELMAFIARWKASDGVSRAEVEEARDIWFSGGVY